jgi:hypothetical protein
MIIYVFKIVEIFLNYMGKIVRAGAGAGIFEKLDPELELEPDKHEPASQHCFYWNLR